MSRLLFSKLHAMGGGGEGGGGEGGYSGKGESLLPMVGPTQGEGVVAGAVGGHAMDARWPIGGKGGRGGGIVVRGELAAHG
jgi:hypothetical protein